MEAQLAKQPDDHRVVKSTHIEIMDVDDLAAYLKVQPTTIYERLRWRAAGEPHPMPAHKMGGYWRFIKREIDEWLVSLPAKPRTRKRKYVLKPKQKAAVKNHKFDR